MDLMWFLFLAHLTGDYALQSDRMAAKKCQDIRSLTLHVLIYTTCIGISLWQFSVWTGAYAFAELSVWGLLIPLGIVHGIQDWIKGRLYNGSRQALYVDQVLHLAQLYAIRLLLLR